MKARAAWSRCDLCGTWDEGIQTTRFWAIKAFLCRVCLSRLCKRLQKGV